MPGALTGGQPFKNSVIDFRLAPFLLYAASPMELTRFTGLAAGAGNTAQGLANATMDAVAETSAYFLKNGFVNPFLYIDRTRYFQSGKDTQVGAGGDGADLAEFLTGAGTTFLKARTTPYIAGTQEKFNLRVHRPILVKIGKQSKNESGITYEVSIKAQPAPSYKMLR